MWFCACVVCLQVHVRPASARLTVPCCVPCECTSSSAAHTPRHAVARPGSVLPAYTYAPTMQDVSDSASRELSLERSLDRMTAEWAGVKFQMMPWKTTGAVWGSGF